LAVFAREKEIGNLAPHLWLVSSHQQHFT